MPPTATITPMNTNAPYWKRYLCNVPMVLTLTGLTIMANIAIAGIAALIPKPKSAEERQQRRTAAIFRTLALAMTLWGQRPPRHCEAALAAEAIQGHLPGRRECRRPITRALFHRSAKSMRRVLRCLSRIATSRPRVRPALKRPLLLRTSSRSAGFFGRRTDMVKRFRAAYRRCGR